jgi:hypothetical protein
VGRQGKDEEPITFGLMHPKHGEKTLHVARDFDVPVA